MGIYLLVSHFAVLYLGMLMMSIKKMTEVGGYADHIGKRSQGLSGGIWACHGDI